jgi:hypothetical protein
MHPRPSFFSNTMKFNSLARSRITGPTGGACHSGTSVGGAWAPGGAWAAAGVDVLMVSSSCSVVINVPSSSLVIPGGLATTASRAGSTTAATHSTTTTTRRIVPCTRRSRCAALGGGTADEARVTPPHAFLRWGWLADTIVPMRPRTETSPNCRDC